MTHHFFLSPHLDDAVLSCGGYLAHLVAQGEPVQVATVFAGAPPADFPFSAFARFQHNGWGVSFEEAYHIRRREDKAALATLGLEPIWMSFWDCIYRGVPADDLWYYTSDEMLFGPVHPAEESYDQVLAEAIQTEFEGWCRAVGNAHGCVFYAPLGVGNHVDHQLVLRAALLFRQRGFPLCLYEDYPYIQRNPADLDRALEACRNLLPDNWTLNPVSGPLSGQEMGLKIDSIAAYATQMDVLFGGEDAMREKVTAFAHHIGNGQPAERLWTIEKE